MYPSSSEVKVEHSERITTRAIEETMHLRGHLRRITYKTELIELLRLCLDVLKLA